ncbi:MAG: hypothetical protein JWP59_3754 [Massilia sp.]|nr:hypothetical protein [Massilia sp.]
MKTETGVMNAAKTDAQMQEEVISQLRKRNAELEAQVAEGKRLLREEMQRGNERTMLAMECRDKIDRLEAEIQAIAPRQEPPGTVMISVQEAWEAAGGSPDVKATKGKLIYELQLLDTLCDDMDVPDRTEAEADLPLSRRAIPRKVALKAIELAYADLATKMEPILRAEPTLGLAGHRRMTAHIQQLCAVEPLPYLEAAIRDAIEQRDKAHPAM